MSKRSAVALLCILIPFAGTQEGCTSANNRGTGTTPRMLSSGDTIAMAQGDTIQFTSGGQLRFLGIVSDSRCKPDVQCIRAGDAEAAFIYVAGSGDEMRFSLHTTLQPMQFQLDPGTIQLESVGWENPPIVTVHMLR